MEKFILFSRQRSGSTVLIRSLDQHPDVLCGGELFNNDDGIHRLEWQFPFINFVKNTPLNINTIKNLSLNRLLNVPWGLIRTNSHLSEYYSQANMNKFKAAGFKLMLSHTKLFPVTKRWLKRKDMKRIVLVRENPLEIFISHLKSQKDGYSHLSRGEKRSDRQVNVNTSILKRRLKKIERDNRYLKAISQNCDSLLINYNELFNWNKLLAKIFRYLEIEDTKIEPVLEKRSKPKFKDNVSNYDEVTKFLNDTKYEKYI